MYNRRPWRFVRRVELSLLLVMPSSELTIIFLGNSTWAIQDFEQPLKKSWKRRKKQGKRERRK
jgi:hypothetical protein